MEKLVYVVWMPEGTPREVVGATMRGEVASELLAAGVLGLDLYLDDEFADVRAPVPPPADEQLPDAVVSLWVDAYDYRAEIETILTRAADKVAGYQVVESLYGDYGKNPHSSARTWPDGERSPGIMTVAFFPERPGMDDDEFYTFWHTKQSPMSEAIQPRCRYVRNAVFRPITDGAPPWRGIVAEAWPSKESVEDPFAFFLAGEDADVLTANVTTMIEHGVAFMDMEQLRSVTMSEYFVKTIGGFHAES